MNKLGLQSKQPGISMLIAVLLISVIVTFSVGVTTLIMDAFDNSNNVRQSTVAYYAAESLLEEALMINKKLKAEGKSIGASLQIDRVRDEENGIFYEGKISIDGRADSLPTKMLNDKSIIPLPWTGNAPWHGEGALRNSGGCNPYNPPKVSGDVGSETMSFANPYTGTGEFEIDAIDHPCNWGKLMPGEKVTLPLFAVDEAGGQHKYQDFSLRLRTPCKPTDDGKAVEICDVEDRLILNCFDKGESAVVCGLYDFLATHERKGEVIGLWQIDAEQADGSIQTLMPFENISNSHRWYEDNDTQLYEGKINKVKDNTFGDGKYEVLKSNENGILLDDKLLNPDRKTSISNFVGDNLHSQPVLKLSVINTLNTCQDNNNCIYNNDSPIGNSGYKAKNIPYLEYQLVVNDDLDGNTSPASLENIITVEGLSGAFNHTLQVKVPHDTSTLEYVIQQ